MTNAFTDEPDDESEEESGAVEEALPAQAAGGTNYITPAGLQRSETNCGFYSPGSAPPSRKWWPEPRATAIAARTPTISTANVGCARSIGGFTLFEDGSTPPNSSTQKLREPGGDARLFGATVRYANAAGAERVVRIIGLDEIDLDRNCISWLSPLARALMKSGAGDWVSFTPRAARASGVVPIGRCGESSRTRQKGWARI